MKSVVDSKVIPMIPISWLSCLFITSSPWVWVEPVPGFYLKEYGRGCGMSLLLHKTVTAVLLRDILRYWLWRNKMPCCELPYAEAAFGWQPARNWMLPPTVCARKQILPLPSLPMRTQLWLTPWLLAGRAPAELCLDSWATETVR